MSTLANPIGTVVSIPVSLDHDQRLEIAWTSLFRWQDRRPPQGAPVLELDHARGTSTLQGDLFSAPKDYAALVHGLRATRPWLEVR